MLGETQNQISFTRAALSTGGREKTNFLSVPIFGALVRTPTQFWLDMLPISLYTAKKSACNTSYASRRSPVRQNPMNLVVKLWHHHH